jgi:isopropylmalate/homocitrate/citramalate synthase
MSIRLFDTTLRDGTQREGVSLTAEDKARIARELDSLGIHYVEAGFPASNPKDLEFFEARRVHPRPPPEREGGRRPGGHAARRPPGPRRVHRRQELEAARREGLADHAGGEPGVRA